MSNLAESLRELARRVMGNARRLAAAREYDGEVTDALRATEAREPDDHAADLVADLTTLAERHGLVLAGRDLPGTALEVVRSGQLAVLSGEELESLEETLAVLADPGAVAAIAEARASNGEQAVPIEQVLRDLRRRRDTLAEA